MQKICLLFAVLCITLFTGCIGGGTHGFIKSYDYNTTKYKLEKAVNQAILLNPAILRDSVKDYYNDDTEYITIFIADKGLANKYIFRYYGGKEHWDSSLTSGIFIAYAYDNERHGGSQGNGGVKPRDSKLRKRLTTPFERELVCKIDSLLRMKHTEEVPQTLFF